MAADGEDHGAQLIADGSASPPREISIVPPLRGKSACSAPPAEGGAVIRERKADGKKALFSTQSFSYGDPIVREAPLLLVPSKENAGKFLKSVGTEGMVAVAQRLGDLQRVAVYAAFCRLPDEKREAVLAMGVNAGSAAIESTEKVIGMFLKDFPQLRSSIDWGVFARAVGIMSDRGSQLPSGERALYHLSDQAVHACAPNAVIENFGENGGAREIRAIAHAGIAEGEEITVSFFSEDVLMLPLEQRRKAIQEQRADWTCACPRCAGGEDAVPLIPLLQHVSAVKKGMDERALRELLAELARFDGLFPVALVGKSRARVKLAQACEECPGDVLLHEAAALYEAALEEHGIVLGQRGRTVVTNLRTKLEQLRADMD